MSSERTVMFQVPSVLSGRLACIAGTVAGRSWDLSAGTFVIGRLEASDLHLPSEAGVSKTHAKIVGEGDHYLLLDCESRNGTIVNGSPVQRYVLRDGDEIRICGCVLRFSQRGAAGVKIRNADPPVDDEPSYEPSYEPSDQPPQAQAWAPEHGPGYGDSTHESAHRDEVDEGAPADWRPGPSYPPRRRVLATWYAGGLVGALLFGGTGTAVLAVTSSPKEADVVADDTENPPEQAPSAPAAPEKAADEQKVAGVAKAEEELAQPSEPAAAVEDPPPSEEAPAKLAMQEPAPDGEKKPALERPEPPREERRERRPTRRDEESDSEGAKVFAATAEGGRSETLKARGGKVRTVEASEGDIVGKGQVLITFEEGDSSDEIATLKDRVASLEGAEDDEARRELRAARAKLEALTSGKGGGPVVAGIAGKLMGFNVVRGSVLRQGETVGRIVEGEVSRRVRVRVDKASRAKKNQSVTLILRRGGEAPGTVSSVKDRNVVVETGDIAADEVEAVRF
jgi:hypothetical protein